MDWGVDQDDLDAFFLGLVKELFKRVDDVGIKNGLDGFIVGDSVGIPYLFRSIVAFYWESFIVK